MKTLRILRCFELQVGLLFYRLWEWTAQIILEVSDGKRSLFCGRTVKVFQNASLVLCDTFHGEVWTNVSFIRVGEWRWTRVMVPLTSNLMNQRVYWSYLRVGATYLPEHRPFKSSCIHKSALQRGWWLMRVGALECSPLLAESLTGWRVISTVLTNVI